MFCCHAFLTFKMQWATGSHTYWLQVTVLKNLTNLFTISGDIMFFGKRYNMGECEGGINISRQHRSLDACGQAILLFRLQGCGPRWC